MKKYELMTNQQFAKYKTAVEHNCPTDDPVVNFMVDLWIDSGRFGTPRHIPSLKAWEEAPLSERRMYEKEVKDLKKLGEV